LQARRWVGGGGRRTGRHPGGGLEHVARIAQEGRHVDHHHGVDPRVGEDRGEGALVLRGGGRGDHVHRVSQRRRSRQKGREVGARRLLEFRHPRTGKNMKFASEMPQDIQKLLSDLNSVK
jgi:hypothetical protein